MLIATTAPFDYIITTYFNASIMNNNEDIALDSMATATVNTDTNSNSNNSNDDGTLPPILLIVKRSNTPLQPPLLYQTNLYHCHKNLPLLEHMLNKVAWDKELGGPVFITNIIDDEHYGVTYNTDKPWKKTKRDQEIYKVPKTHIVKIDEKRKRCPTKIPPSPEQQHTKCTNRPMKKFSVSHSVRRPKPSTTTTTKSSATQPYYNREYEVKSMKYIWSAKRRKGWFHVKWKNSKKSSYLDLGDFASPDQVKQACELALNYHNMHENVSDDDDDDEMDS